MGQESVRRYCPEHGQVLAVQKTPHHVVHLILSIVTFGIWLPFWFLAAISRRRPLCPTCGADCVKWPKRGIGS